MHSHRVRIHNLFYYIAREKAIICAQKEKIFYQKTEIPTAKSTAKRRIFGRKIKKKIFL